MEPLNKLDKYLKMEEINLETDSYTKEIIKEYYAELKLKAHWRSILENDLTTKAEKGNPPINLRKPLNKKSIQFLLLLLILLIIIWLGWNFSNTVPQTKIEQLIAEQYSEPVTRDLVKSNNTLPTSIQNAYNFYQEKNYKAAIPLLSELSRKDEMNEDHHFFLGLSYLYNKEPQKAIREFDWILDQSLSQRHDAATWYIALAYTEIKNYDKAVLYLNEVSNWNANTGKRKMAEDAKQLLQAIQKNN